MGLLGRKVSDLGFVEFMSILEAKADQRGKMVIKIDRFDPSSQTCSVCGHRQRITLSERSFVCLGCGSVMDRDHNAARNIKSWGINSGLESVRRSKTASLV
jgi:putative transposase